MIDPGTLPNPFRDNVVQDAWQSPPDVAEIHDQAFAACLLGIDSASQGVPDSLVIYGPAGSGKTHLLTRLQRHLAETARQAPDQQLRCVLVFVRLQSSPRLLWQHVRRRLASDLMRRDQGLTQLQRLIAHQLGHGSGASPRRGIFRLRVLGSLDRQALHAHLAELMTQLQIPRELCVILERLVCEESMRDAAAWLAGESLPDGVLQELGLGPDSVEDREDAAREVVTALCRLAGETLPMVFCFDQVEALQRSRDDEDAFFRFGRMAADLHDADANVFLITCLQSAFFDKLERIVRQADLERMAKRRAVLKPLDRGLVEKLVCSRLEAVPDLQLLRGQRGAEAHFPFSPKFLDELAGETSSVPRRVLAGAARRFEEWQRSRAAPRPSDADFLQEQLHARRIAALQNTHAADTTRLFLQGMQVLSALGGVRISDEDDEHADLVLEGPRKVALSLRNEADGRSLGPKLKTLLDHVPRRDGARLVIVRDPRLAVSKGSIKTRQYLAELRERGALLVEPSVEALAALEALSSLLADANSGDLANDGDTLAESQVLSWLTSMRRDLGVEPIEALLSDVMAESPEPSPGAEMHDLAAWLGHEHVAELDVASAQLGHPSERLLAIAHQYGEHFLVLEGPPTLLLDMAAVMLETDR